MGYIHRDIEGLVAQADAEYPALIVTGPRQVGKTTLLLHMAAESDVSRTHVTLDDLNVLSLAKSDPKMFFQMYEPPILIDEVQEAPELFREIKRLIDAGAPMGSFWLTGSQQFRLMELVGESLAGRIAVLPLTSLSQHEVYANGPAAPFKVEKSAMKARVSQYKAVDANEIYARIHRGAMPAVVAGRHSNLELYYSSYVQTFIERDVRRMMGKLDALQFNSFITAVAARCSQMLNVSSIANDIGERVERVKQWLAVLERSGVIFYLHPYSNNQLKRTVKASKLYFNDCGLVAYLTKWSSPETMLAGAMSGAFLENYVVSEVYKSYLSIGANIPLYYYRDHDSKEIDLVLESDGLINPVEVKKTASPSLSMASSFGVLRKSLVPKGDGALICMADGLGALDAEVFVYPVWGL